MKSLGSYHYYDKNRANSCHIEVIMSARSNILAHKLSINILCTMLIHVSGEIYTKPGETRNLLASICRKFCKTKTLEAR